MSTVWTTVKDVFGGTHAEQAALLAVTQRAPWFAGVFAWELARPPLVDLPVLVLAAVLARMVALGVDRLLSRRRAAHRAA